MYTANFKHWGMRQGKLAQSTVAAEKNPVVFEYLCEFQQQQQVALLFPISSEDPCYGQLAWAWD